MSLQPFKFDTAYTHTHTHPFNGPFSGCPSCRPTNSVKALKGYIHTYIHTLITCTWYTHQMPASTRSPAMSSTQAWIANISWKLSFNGQTINTENYSSLSDLKDADWCKKMHQIRLAAVLCPDLLGSLCATPDLSDAMGVGLLLRGTEERWEGMQTQLCVCVCVWLVQLSEYNSAARPRVSESGSTLQWASTRPSKPAFLIGEEVVN